MRPLFSERRFSRVSNTRLGYRCRQLEPDWAAHQLCLLKDVLQSVLGQDSEVRMRVSPVTNCVHSGSLPRACEGVPK